MSHQPRAKMKIQLLRNVYQTFRRFPRNAEIPRNQKNTKGADKKHPHDLLCRTIKERADQPHASYHKPHESGGVYILSHRIRTCYRRPHICFLLPHTDACYDQLSGDLHRDSSYIYLSPTIRCDEKTCSAHPIYTVLG